MSLYKRVQALPVTKRDYIHSLYDEHFPLIIRSTLAEFIENQQLSEVKPDQPQHQEYANHCRCVILQQLKNFDETNKVSEKSIEIRCAIHNLTYNYDSCRVINKLVRNLRIEMSEVLSEMGQFGSTYHHNVNEIGDNLQVLKKRIREFECETRKILYEQEQYVIQWQDSVNRERMLRLPQANSYAIKLGLGRLDKEQIDNALRNKLPQILDMIDSWSSNIDNTINAIMAMQNYILNEELTKWKRGQQRAAIGFEFNNNLDEIQVWCETLAETLWRTRHQLESMENICARIPSDCSFLRDRIKQQLRSIENLLNQLVSSTFIVEEQPQQVLRTSTQFCTKVRLLVGTVLNVHMSAPKVRVSLVNSVNGRNGKNDCCGTIINNDAKLDLHVNHMNNHRTVIAEFKSMKLTKPKRADKKGMESVVDEKFALLFQCKIVIASLECFVSTLSLPIVVTVHALQEPKAWGTIVWDNAFAEPKRAGFEVPTEVSWSDMTLVLKIHFKHKSGVKKGLTSEHLRYLAAKALNTHPSIVNTDERINWMMFAKEPVNDRNVSFWEWFYATTKLCKEHLDKLWDEDYIIGFISREDAHEKLKQTSIGTFLLRFSDSAVGSLSISAHGEDGEVFDIEPWNSNDFKMLCLANRILDIKQICFIYPYTPKEDAFKQYMTKVEPNTQHIENKQDYVRTVLKTEIVKLHLLPRKDKRCITNHLDAIEALPTPPSSTASVEEEDMEFIAQLINREDVPFDIAQYINCDDMMPIFEERFGSIPENQFDLNQHFPTQPFYEN